LNQTASLKFDVGSCQIIDESLAKLVRGTNAFARYQREHTGGVLFGLLADDILLGSPCGIPDSIQSVPEIRQNIWVYIAIAGEQQLVYPLKLRYGLF
jgi:hypothetical protein